MGNIHVVLDSTSHVTDDFLARHKILHKASLRVRIGEREWKEDELSCTDLFAETKRTGIMQQTSQPPIGEFVQMFQEIVDAGDEAIVICVSGALSGTVQGARTAAKMVDEKKIHVLDAQTAAVGLVRLAEIALQMIEENRSVAEIMVVLEAAVKKTHTLLLPDSLEYLHRGGRIGGAAAIFGSILQIKPVLYLTEGRVTILDKVRTRKRAIQRLIDEVAKVAPLEYIGIVHVEAKEECEEIQSHLEELYPDVRVSLTEAGSVVGSHTGPRTLAFIYQEKL